METGPRNRNREVAGLLESIGDLLEIQGEVPFKINAYRKAAARIEALREPIELVQREGRLRKIQGIGPALEQKISEYLETGKLAYYDKLSAEFPPGLVELIEIPGLGPRTARLIFDALGVGDVDSLEQAARAGRLRAIPGLGAKTEENILRELERLKERSDRKTLGQALLLAEELLDDLRQRVPANARLSHAGSLRRMADTIGDIDLLAAADDTEAVVRAFTGLPTVLEVLSAGPVRASVLVRGGLQADLRVVEPRCWGAALLYFTGSKAHNLALRERAVRQGWKLNEYGLFEESSGRCLASEQEADLYRAFGLEYIPPELREDDGELEAAAAGRLPKLIELADLRGDLHVHSDWSDGSEPLEAMARAARDSGLEYMAITDHSKSLGIARGLNEERVRQQRALVNRLNQELAPFRILHGTEMDILRDGQLDYADDLLAEYDYVSASIHSAMKQEQAQMTARIQRALRNRYVHTLNHPHGRLIPQRPAYAVDMQAVVDTAIAEGVALEINAQPERMDLEGSWARRARLAGARFVINTDSHAASQYAFRRLGVGSARRGWLSAADVLNSLPLERLLVELQRRRNGQGG
jgi:DNA polymerase (family 10)